MRHAPIDQKRGGEAGIPQLPHETERDDQRPSCGRKLNPPHGPRMAAVVRSLLRTIGDEIHHSAEDERRDHRSSANQPASL